VHNAGRDIRSVDLASGDRATMQTCHHYMQELFGRHTVLVVGAALDSMRWGIAVRVMMVQV
jgi:hypothetical protein